MFLAPDDVLWEKSGERNGKLYGSMREMICGWLFSNPGALEGIYHGTTPNKRIIFLLKSENGNQQYNIRSLAIF